MDSIASVRARLPVDYDRVLGKIRKAGTDNLSFFGCGYELEGGYSLQQNPEEFTAAVVWLQEKLVHRPSPKVYLEIGSASGGACRFLYEHIGFGQIWVVDDHGHHRWPEQQANFDAVGTRTFYSAENVAMSREPVVSKWVGNSSSPECAKWVESVTRIHRPDLSFIDGDHSFDGCWSDFKMVHGLSHVVGPAGRLDRFVMFHDIVAVEGVRRAWRDAIETRLLEPLAELVGAERPLGIGIGRLT